MDLEMIPRVRKFEEPNSDHEEGSKPSLSHVVHALSLWSAYYAQGTSPCNCWAAITIWMICFGWIIYTLLLTVMLLGIMFIISRKIRYGAQLETAVFFRWNMMVQFQRCSWCTHSDFVSVISDSNSMKYISSAAWWWWEWRSKLIQSFCLDKTQMEI